MTPPPMSHRERRIRLELADLTTIMHGFVTGAGAEVVLSADGCERMHRIAARMTFLMGALSALVDLRRDP